MENRDTNKIHAWASYGGPTVWRGSERNAVQPGQSITIETSVDIDKMDEDPTYIYVGRNGEVLATYELIPPSDNYNLKLIWDGKSLKKQ